MTTHSPTTEEPGFEHDVNVLPQNHSRSEDTLEDRDEDEESVLEEAQEQAAEEREEGGYQ